MRLTTIHRTECLTIEEMLYPYRNPAEAAAIAELSNEDRATVDGWLDALAPVLEGPRRGRGERLALAAQQMAVPTKTARNKFDALQRDGWRGLLDKRRRKARSKMADVDCADLPAFSNWIKGMAENYGGNVRQAHKAAVALWKTALKSHGKIPGYAAVPYPSLNGLPKGWSYPNINRIAKLNRYERAISGVGRAAARQHAPMVVRTRVGLHVGEVLMVDDGWHDVDCHMLGSQRDFVRALELAVIDVYSAHKPTWGIKPRIRDEATGKRINLRATEMRLLNAHHFCNIGYWPERCLVFQEHGTANTEDRVARILSDSSNGAIQFKDGGIQDKPALLGSWGGKKAGNPRLKAAIESAWRNPHFMAKWLPGQTGGDSRNNLPEDHHGRERYHKELVAAVEHAASIMPAERLQWVINELAAPVMSYYAYAQIVAEFYRVIECFTDHELEGWEQEGLIISGFRPSISSIDFFPYGELARLSPEEAFAVRAILRNNPELNISRRMSRLEVFNAGRRHLKRLPPEVFPMIVGEDLAVERKVRRGLIAFEDSTIERGRKFAYPAIATNSHGLEVILKEGETYNTVFNPFDMSRLYVLDAGFRLIGTLSEQIVVSHADMEAAHRAMGQAAHAEAVAMLPYRMRHADREGEEQRAREHNKALLSGMVLTPEERRVRDRAHATANERGMAELSAALQPVHAAAEEPEEPADLSDIFGTLPGAE